MKTTLSATTDFPLYVSNRTFKSMGQKYLIFQDRLELRTFLFGKFTIKFEELEKVELRRPNIQLMWDEMWKYKNLHYAIKLDIADFYEHLGVYKKSGWVHLLLFTPENPLQFKQYLERAATGFSNRRFTAR